MSFNDFFEILKKFCQAKHIYNKQKLDDVQVVKFVRGTAKMFGKTSYAGENFNSSRFLQRKIYIAKRYILKKNIAESYDRNKENRGMKPANKYRIIEVLCPHMKNRTQHFWHQLNVDEVFVDLVNRTI